MRIRARIFLIVAIVMATITFSPITLAAKSEDKKVEQAHVRVNINSAKADVISDALVGVGLKKAQAIVAYRKKNGRFKSVEDLVLVKGIGNAILEKNRSRITL